MIAELAEPESNFWASWNQTSRQNLTQCSAQEPIRTEKNEVDSSEEKNNADEAWRPVVGYEHRYEVSNWGRVRSIKSKARRGPGHLVGSLNKAGYKVVRLSQDDGSSRLKEVHRMVLDAFRGPRPRLVPDHLNDERADNRIENLE